MARQVPQHAPMCLLSSVMNAWQKRMTSLSDLPLGSKSQPPLPPPIGSVVRLFFRICAQNKATEINKTQNCFTDVALEMPAQ